ncbi:MAG: GNAT family N-acetyltransferase [Paraclostridium sp.]
MNLRYAKRDDLNVIKDIWNYCFGDEEAFVEYYFNNKYKENNTIVVEDDGEIVSSLQLNQYNIKLNNNIYETSYVVGVSTYPQARGKGFMKNIMDFSLNEMYNRGQLVSLLMPIDYRLYRKYGYEHCYDQLEYKLDVESLRQFKIQGDFVKAKNENIKDMINIYNTCLKSCNGYTHRDVYYYENLFKEIKCENGHIYIHKEDAFEGYVIYFINGDTLFVRELLYKNIKSLKSILKFLYNHNTQAKNITIMSPIIDDIRYILPNLKNNTINIKPFMMGRVINLEGFIKSIEVEVLESEKVILGVIDKQIEANNGCFEIYIENNKVMINKANKDADLSLDINYVNQLAFSYLDLKQVLFLNNIEIEDKIYNTLDKIFTKKKNYINEYV